MRHIDRHRSAYVDGAVDGGELTVRARKKIPVLVVAAVAFGR